MLQNQRGQTSIFLALFVTTMMLLFAFTTNIGMLVHAKINLQNAADSAAYAGAAVQARQLTAVAYLNWEMRRSVKQFLYYYMVRGTNAHTCFPYDAQGRRVQSGAVQCPNHPAQAMYKFALFDPRATAQAQCPTCNEPEDGKALTGMPFIPSVCVIFSEQNNYCQKAKVAGVPQVLGGDYGVANAIIQTVREATDVIIAKKLDDCRGRTEVNYRFLGDWLLNLTPTPQSVHVQGETPKRTVEFDGYDALGFLPKMAMLRARIDNFEEKLNVNLEQEGLGQNITKATLDSLAGNAGGPRGIDYYERSIQGFLSAYNNLPRLEDNGIFSEISMQELLPSQAGADQNPHQVNPPILAKFNDITMNTNLASSKFTGQGTIKDANTPEELAGACEQTRELWPIPKFPLGIAKDPRVPTYYAVKLKANVRLLFSPFGGNGTITLSAYSAARPFGSRIGIDLSKQLEKTAFVAGAKNAADEANLDVATFPNVLVSTYDNDSRLTGFASNGHLGYLRAFAVAAAGPFAPSPIVLDDVDRLRLAGAYAPWEIGYYTIPANYNIDGETASSFENNPFYDPANGNVFQLPAPLMPVNKAEQSLSFLRGRVQEYITADGFGDLSSSQVLRDIVGGILTDDNLTGLMNFLQTSPLKLDRIHPIPDPMLHDRQNALAYARQAGTDYTVAAQNNAMRRQLSSWANKKYGRTDGGNPAKGELLAGYGRSSYSVRLVSFASLMAGLKLSNDPLVGDSTPNPFSRVQADDNLMNDLARIKH